MGVVSVRRRRPDLAPQRAAFGTDIECPGSFAPEVGLSGYTA